MRSAGYTGVRVIHELFSNNSFRPCIANVVRAIHRCGQYTDPFSKSSLGAGYTRCAGYTRVRAIFANLRYFVLLVDAQHFWSTVIFQHLFNAFRDA